MNRSIRVSARAAADADSIFEWIEARSLDGAVRWYQAFLTAIQVLTERAESCAVAPEAERLGVDLRQTLFKTRKGRLYRALFLIEKETICIVGVRGAGQDSIGAGDIELPA